MSSPQIIRTVEELEALDPDTILARNLVQIPSILPAGYLVERRMYSFLGHMVVLASGSQVRAARKALEGEAKPTRPDAHEMQGILGSDWLDGEDPADLVRRHREGRA